MNKYEGFVGKVLDGRYKILELVGLGGMACVLKAQDIVMNRIVAIKILNDEYTGNEAAEARFIDESKAVAMLSNKNIVSVYDVAIYPDIKYIVMEYLDGITLREYLDNKGILNWKEACVYILQILRALEHAHSKGIIHRDIKPQNVILMKNGDIKVTDFGIAKLPKSVSQQQDEKAVGTVYYISPEQACGKETDYYSDIYSVGIMFYEAITGQLPFTAETPMEVAMMQVNDEPVHPRDIILDIPVGVSQIILKAMEKSPDDRFQSVHSMIKAIEWVIRYPDVIFNMSDTASDENAPGNSSVVSIDMISTAELEPYGDDEITDPLGKKNKPSGNEASTNTKKPKKSKPAIIKKHKSNRTMFPIICGVSFSFLIVAVVLAILVITSALQSFTAPNDDNMAKFPELTTQLYSEALETNLRNGTYGARFVIDEIIEVNNDERANNEIISTEPAGGHWGKPSDDDCYHFTQILVNKTEKVTIPNVNNYLQKTAENLLTGIGLFVEYEYVDASYTNNKYFEDDQVIGISPEVGEEVTVGSTVTLRIFQRTSSTTTAPMPYVIGMTEAEAIKFAHDYAFYEVTIKENPVAGGNNRISAQSIKEGKVSTKGTTVLLTLDIPLQSFTMPNLLGKTYDEARAMLDAASPEHKIEMSTMFFELDESLRPDFEIDCANITNVADFTKLIEDNYPSANQYFDYDGMGTVIFQGIPADTEVSFDILAVEIIVITYTNKDTNDESGDVSDGDNGFTGPIFNPDNGNESSESTESSETTNSDESSEESAESSEPDSGDTNSAAPEHSTTERSEGAV